jgi:hypothetical protein
MSGSRTIDVDALLLLALCVVDTASERGDLHAMFVG